MPVTTRIIIPDSGSSRNPQVTWNSPTPLLVSSGMRGIHSATVTSNARASAGSPSNCQNANSDRASAASIIVTATAPAVLRENERMPIRPLIAAPMPGRMGINQIYRISRGENGGGGVTKYIAKPGERKAGGVGKVGGRFLQFAPVLPFLPTTS